MRKTLMVLGIAALALAGCKGNGDTDSSASTGGAKAGPKNTWVYFVEPVRGEYQVEAPTDLEKQRADEHFAYVKQLTDEGVVLMAGPTLDEPYTGIVVFTAKNRAEAEKVMYNDPAIKSSVFVSRLSPMTVSLVGDM